MISRREIRSIYDFKEFRGNDRDERKLHNYLPVTSTYSSSYCFGSSRVAFCVIGSCLWGAVWGYLWGRFFVEESKVPTLAAGLETCQQNGHACFEHFDFDSSGALSVAELEAALVELRKEAWWLTPGYDREIVRSLPDEVTMDTSVSYTPSSAAKFAMDRFVRASYVSKRCH